MKRIYLTLILLITGLFNVFAQYKVSGLVVNSSDEPQEFASIRIFTPSDSVKPVAFGVTDDKGMFVKTLSKPGEYIIHASVVGLADAVRKFEVSRTENTVDLGTLRCGDATNLLGNVTVTAQKPLVVKEIDRIGYDVQADITSRTSSLQEVLRNVPLVSVEPDGTIKVKGSSDFKIYKNGRPNNSFTKNAKEIFKAIPASMIKKIEVITDPGAREDAEGIGAILNIVTVEGSSIKGAMANLGLNYDTDNNLPSPNLWGSAQIDKVTLSSYLGSHFASRRSSRHHSLTEGVYEDSGNKSFSSNTSENKGGVLWWGIEGSYEADSMNLVTLEFGGYYYDMKSFDHGFQSLTAANGSPLYSYRSKGLTSPTSYLDFNGNLNYQHSTRRKGEIFTVSYMVSTTNEHNNSSTEYYDRVNMPVNYDGIVSDFKLNFMEHTFQTDWTRPFANIHTVDVGMKYIFRDNNSKTHQQYTGTDRSPFTDFSHHTHIAAVFGDYRVRLSRVSLRAGLRYEFSRLSAKYADGSQPDFGSNLSDWVPNAAVAYDINDRNNIKLSFGTRINRPGISYLNPAISESPTATSQGNPDLGSSRNSSLNLNYSLLTRKLNLDFTAGYSFTNNDIVSVQRIEGDHTYSGYANAGHNKSVDLSLFMQWTISGKTSVMANLGGHYNHYANPSINITNGGWSGNGFVRLTQKLPWKLSANLGMFAWKGGCSLYSNTLKGSFNYFLSFSRNFLKEDRLSVRLDIQNPIGRNSFRYKSESCNTSYRYTSSSIRENVRSFRLGISYRFGSMKGSVKKTSKGISNDDLVGRKQNGGES